MDRYLFRGKRVDNGEWVEGYYSPLKLLVFGEMGHYINVGGYKAVEVDPKTVGQYTGLTDKNGKKIFEGDNVLYDRNINSKTDKLIFTVCWNGNGYELDGGWFDEDMTSPELLEIIGNIHESEVS